MFGSEKNPKGPNFKKARLIEKDLSGSKLSFMAPPYKDPFSSLNSWEDQTKYFDITDTATYKAVKSANKQDVKGLSWARVYSSIWEFRGRPILEGYCGEVKLLINLCSIDDLPVNESLFDNRILAREVHRYLDTVKLKKHHEGYSEDPSDLTQHRWPSYLGPINSQWVSLDEDFLYFEDIELVSVKDTISWCSAISDKQYLNFQFIINRSAANAGNTYRIEQRIPRTNYQTLAVKIMNTLSLKLSPATAARKTQIQLQTGASEKTQIRTTEDQKAYAKHTLYMWSGRGYTALGKSVDDDHRANPEDVAAFIDQRLKPRALANSYPLGEPLTIVADAN